MAGLPQLVSFPVSVRYIGQDPVARILFNESENLESVIFTPGVTLTESLVRDFFDDDVRHGQDDKLVSCNDLVSLEAQPPNVAGWAPFSSEGDKWLASRPHGIVCFGGGREDVVTEGDAEVTLCVELEAGKLFVRTYFVNGGGVGLQVNAIHTKMDAPYDERMGHDERESQIVAPMTTLEGPRHALNHGHVLAGSHDGHSNTAHLQRSG